jgi:hypothetical protein
MATTTDNTKLAVANRASFWLVTPIEYKEYGKPSNFFNFTSVDNPDEMQVVYNSYDWMRDKIYGIGSPVKQPYLFMKKVTDGRAAAIYTYAPFLVLPDGSIDTRALSILEVNIIAVIDRWDAANKQQHNPPAYNPNEDKFCIVTTDLTHQVSTSL